MGMHPRHRRAGRRRPESRIGGPRRVPRDGAAKP